MIDSLKPYPAMRDSGVPWLGEVPEHWGVGTLRRKLRSYDGIKIGPFGIQLKLEQMVESGFKVYGQGIVIARDFARCRKFIDQGKFDELSACAVRAGDLVVTMMGTSGRCAKVPDDAVPGIMDSHLIRLRTTLDINRTFASRVIDEAPYIKEQIEVVGKGSIMHGLNSGMIKDLLLALPPLPEQAAIVRFLDYADRRIRRYIRAKQKLIKLLEEQKQAIIHRAITRGIDPNVRLKPSGVEWLGDVPEHWTIRLLGRCLERIDQGWSPVAAEGELVPEQWAVLTLSSVKRGVFDPTAVKPVPVTARVPSGIEVTNGDVLLTRSNTRELVGDVCLAKAVRPRTVICDLIYRLAVLDEARSSATRGAQAERCQRSRRDIFVRGNSSFLR